MELPKISVVVEAVVVVIVLGTATAVSLFEEQSGPLSVMRYVNRRFIH